MEEETLRANLNDGEKILWRSAPEAFETLDKTHKPDFVRKTTIGAVIAIGFILFLTLLGTMNSRTWILIVVVALLCAIPPINIFSDASKIRKSEYIATTERLLILRGEVKSAEYSTIRAGAFREDADGHTSLLCGTAALKAKPCKRREICAVAGGSLEEKEECERFCFYAVKDEEALKQILHEKMPSVF